MFVETRIQDIAIRLFVTQFKILTVTKFNIIFANWQRLQVVEWRVNLCFKAISALIIREMTLPNSSCYGTIFILNVNRLKPTATCCKIKDCIFPISVCSSSPCVLLSQWAANGSLNDINWVVSTKREGFFSCMIWKLITFTQFNWISFFKTIPFLRRLVASISPGRIGFDPRPVEIGFVVQKVTL